MGLKINGTDTTSVLFNSQNVNKVTYNGNVVWCRRFSINVSVGQNVESYSITRTSTEVLPKPQAGISDGDTIYYGDVLRVDARPMNGYQMDRTYPYNLTVTNYTSVSFNATVEKFDLLPAVVTATWNVDYRGAEYMACDIHNPNLKIVSMSYRVVDASGRTTLVEETMHNEYIKSLGTVKLTNFYFPEWVEGGTLYVTLYHENANNSPVSSAVFGQLETSTN